MYFLQFGFCLIMLSVTYFMWHLCVYFIHYFTITFTVFCALYYIHQGGVFVGLLAGLLKYYKTDFHQTAD